MLADFIVTCVYLNKKMADWKLLENIIGDWLTALIRAEFLFWLKVFKLPQDTK